MDPTPKTRRETKKTAKEKKSSVYSQKHIRQQLSQRAAAKTGR
jgi:hypothetical protein